MPQITYTDEVNRRLAEHSSVERIRSEVAILLGEVQWRRVALGQGDFIREESDEMTPEDIDSMLAFYQEVADGRQPACISEIKWMEDEQKELEADLSGATEDEHRQRLLNFEAAALLEKAEERTVALEVERVTSARQHGPETTDGIVEILGQFKEKGIGTDSIEALEEAIFDPTGPNRAMLVTDATRRVLAADATPEWIAEAPEPVDVIAAIDLDEDITHCIDGAGATFEELSGETFSTNCGVELLDIGDSVNGRIMQLTMIGASKGNLASCGECMPELSGKKVDIAPPS